MTQSEAVLTAVIVSYNKHDYLRSQLAYYSNRPIHLVLADGSHSDWGSGTSGAIGQMTWEYFRIPGSETLLQRMFEGCSRVKTEFMFFQDDEDCNLWTGLIRATKFLRSNPEYSVAGGSVVFVAPIISRRRLGIIRHGQHGKVVIDDDSPIARVKRSIRVRKSSFFYLVRRTSETLKYAECMAEVPLAIGIPFGSPCLTLFSAASGKIRTDLYPFSIRRQGAETVATPKSALAASLSVENAVDLSNRLTQALSRTTGSNDNELQMISEQISEILLENYQSRIRQPVTLRARLRQYIFGFVMLRIFDLFPRLYRLLRPGGVQTIKQYSETASDFECFPEVLDDVFRLENLWLAYPEGLSNHQFAEYSERF